MWEPSATEGAVCEIFVTSRGENACCFYDLVWLYIHRLFKGNGKMIEKFMEMLACNCNICSTNISDKILHKVRF